MKGHIRERGKGNWYAVLDVLDPETGKRKRKWHKLDATGKKEAETEKAALITQLVTGTYIDPQKTTLAEYLERWLTATQAERLPSHVRAVHRTHYKKHKPFARQRAAEKAEWTPDR